MSDTEKPSWEWRALAMARERETEEELAEWRMRAQDRQTANEWLAKRVDELQQQLATVTQERDAFKWKYELVHHDQDYQQCCALRHVAERQLDETTVHLEAQRTATYQAVAREHAAKAQLAAVTTNKAQIIYDWVVWEEAHDTGRPTE